MYENLIDSNLVEIRKTESKYPCLDGNSYTPCGIFAKQRIRKKSSLQILCGALAECPADSKIWDNHFSLMIHKDKTNVLLGPVSFINHSCSPNSTFVQRADRMVIIHTLK